MLSSGGGGLGQLAVGHCIFVLPKKPDSGSAGRSALAEGLEEELRLEAVPRLQSSASPQVSFPPSQHFTMLLYNLIRMKLTIKRRGLGRGLQK